MRTSELPVPVAGGMLSASRFGPDRDVPLVVAVHGITGSSRSWVPVARALGDRAALIAIDIRGRGRSSELPGPYGMGAHVADLLAVVDAFSPSRPAVLVGHSLGAYIVTRFAVTHPDRVRSLLLIDGGLEIPGTENVEPQAFLDAFLGPALARLRLRFADRDAYRDWWRAHPALSQSDVEDADIVAYADYDLVGTEPELHSCVIEESVRADAAELLPDAGTAHRLAITARLLCAPRGLLDDPKPMQPLETAQTWAAADPGRRSAELVPDVNHYTITMGASGASAVAGEIFSAAVS